MIVIENARIKIQNLNVFLPSAECKPCFINVEAVISAGVFVSMMMSHRVGLYSSGYAVCRSGDIWYRTKKTEDQLCLTTGGLEKSPSGVWSKK